MAWLKNTGIAVALVATSACNMTGQAYPGRTEVQLMSADQVTMRTYACMPGDSLQQTQNRAVRAHRYVDGAIRSAQSRIPGQNSEGLGVRLGARAELNAEIAEISRQAEIEYRCQLVGSRSSEGIFG